MNLLITAAAALALASPALAQGPGQSAPEAQSPANQGNRGGVCVRGETVDGERCICRRVQADSTSRLTNRTICRTSSGWRDWEREAR